MKIFNKKLFAVVVCLLLVFLSFAFSTSAATSSIISFSKNSVNVGETLTVTVKFSSDHSIYAANAKISYDPEVLQFVSSSDKYNGGSGLLIMAPASSSQTFTFKALKTGSCTFRVYDASVSDGDEEYTATGCSAAVKVVDKTATLSANANLKSLIISAGSLSPAFSPSVTSYSITIDSTVAQLTVSAKTEDANAKVNVTGSKDMKVGTNQRVITVTAPNGATKSYTLNITKLAPTTSSSVSDIVSSDVSSETEDTSSVIPTDDIMIDGNIFNITTEAFAEDSIPLGFTATTATYNSVQYPSLTNKSGSMTVFNLFCEATHTSGLYMYNASTGEFTPFSYLTSSGGTYIMLTADDSVEIPEGFTESVRTISGNDITVYSNSDTAEFYLLYAEGPSGNTGLYVYDPVENTIQRFFGLFAPANTEPVESENLVSMLLNNPTYRMIIICSCIAVGLVLLVLIIVLIVKKKSDANDDYGNEEDDEDIDLYSNK